jgi:hypothetical protein
VAAPAWSGELGRVTFRAPENANSEDARARYYQPVAQTLATLARNKGVTKPDRVIVHLLHGPPYVDEAEPEVEHPTIIAVATMVP